MTKRLFTIAVLSTLTLFVFQMAAAQEMTKACCQKEAKSEVKNTAIKMTEPDQTECPVTGNPIDKKIFVDHEDQRIYFCCQACVDKFKANPEKYLDKMKKDGVLLETIECLKGDDCCQVVTCCVSGHAVNKEIFTEVEGKKIYFCSETCKEKFEKNPKAYLKTCSKKCGNCSMGHITPS